MKARLFIKPLMAMGVMVSMLCSCGNGSKKQIDSSADSLSITSEEVESNPLVGMYYKGEGYCGGMSTEMAISFSSDGKCECFSDFYQAYPDKVFINGTYEVKENTVIVHCKVEDSTIDYEFGIEDGGETISFDLSDPEMGRLGMNILTLKKVDAKTYAEFTDTTTTYEQETYVENNFNWLEGHWVYQQGNYVAHLVFMDNTVQQYSTLNPEPTYYTFRADGNKLYINPIRNDGTDFVVTLDFNNHRIDYGDGNWMHKIN